MGHEEVAYIEQKRDLGRAGHYIEPRGNSRGCIRAGGTHRRRVRPATFNAALGPGTCVGDGDVTFAEFRRTADQSEGVWPSASAGCEGSGLL
jgi:hypothetical protein